MPPVALAILPAAASLIPGIGIIGGLAAGVGISALTSLLQPKLPKPADGTVATKQALPSRIRGYGTALLGGAFIFRESVINKGIAHQIVAWHHGRANRVVAIWLHDEEVTLDGAGRVIDPGHFGAKVDIFTRLGAVPEIAYTETVDQFPALWTSSHRGDGVASILVIARDDSPKKHSRTFPNGLPIPKVLGELSLVWDPRDPEQDPNDPSTWKWSDNWALCILDWLTNPDGLGLDRARYIMPALDEWIAEADYCDQHVTLKDGASEPRYRLNSFYQLDNDPADVAVKFLAQADGWMATRPDGAIVVKSGRYETPKVTIPAKHILDYTLVRQRPREETINQIRATYVSPPHGWVEVEAQDWTDEENVSRVGKVLSTDLDLTGCISHGQARRIMKRAAIKARAQRGIVVTDLYGQTAMGERYINLDFGGELGRGIISVEVERLHISLATCRVLIEWMSVGPEIDHWNPVTEEGDPPPVPTRNFTNRDAWDIEATNFNAIADPVPLGDGRQGVRLRATLDNIPDRAVEWLIQYREVEPEDHDPLGPWTTEEAQDINPAAAVVEHLTAVVNDGATYEVRAQGRTAGGAVYDFGSSVFVTAIADTAAPGAPLDVEASGGATTATLTWTNPNSPNVYAARVWRVSALAPDPTFEHATDVSGPIYAGGSVGLRYVDEPPAGTWRYWVTAENASGSRSAPTQASSDAIVGI